MKSPPPAGIPCAAFLPKSDSLVGVFRSRRTLPADTPVRARLVGASRRHALALLLVAGLATAGCAQPAATDSGAAAVVPADRAWEEVLQAAEPLDIPEEWVEEPAVPAEIERFHRRSGGQAAQAADRARQFYTRFPDHPRASRARLLEAELLAVAVHLGESSALSRLQSAEETLRKEPKADEDARFNIRSAGVQRIAYYLQFAGYMANLDEFEKNIRELQQDYPKRTEPFELLSVLARNRFYEDQIREARQVAEELTVSAAPGSIVEDAKAMMKRFNRLGKPVPFKFTDLKGHEVDFEKLQGRVVLVDCWATWCPPCVREIPRLRKLYEKYHRKGFEIVGISSDDDRSALDQFVTKQKIPWPQFFDGKGESNRFAVEYSITGVPTMWLLDKKGVLRELNALKNLSSKIETLLAE